VPVNNILAAPCQTGMASFALLFAVNYRLPLHFLRGRSSLFALTGIIIASIAIVQ
jgi:hypothetical protein